MTQNCVIFLSPVVVLCLHFHRVCNSHTDSHFSFLLLLFLFSPCIVHPFYFIHHGSYWSYRCKSTYEYSFSRCCT